MTKEEIIDRIDTAISEMQALKNEVQNIPEENNGDSVPEKLIWEEGDTAYYVAASGNVDYMELDKEDAYYDKFVKLNKRWFKTQGYAEEFQRKTQFIAGILHFKWLYDRDFEPNYEKAEAKHFVFYHHGTGKYLSNCHDMAEDKSQVYFSTKEIAQKCADWLNSRKEKENDKTSTS